MTKRADELTEAASVLESLDGNTDDKEAASEADWSIIDVACCSEEVNSDGVEASRDDVAGPA